MPMDATFEDGGEKPLRLRAEDGDDLSVVSTLVQDAVFPVSEISWSSAKGQFGILMNRFRWEDRDAAQKGGRAFERVQTVLAIDGASKVLTQGVSRDDKDTILSVLSVTFEAAEDGAGRIILNLAGDGAIGIDVECIDVTLQDVTRPYIAPSKSQPKHPE